MCICIKARLLENFQAPNTLDVHILNTQSRVKEPTVNKIDNDKAKLQYYIIKRQE